MIDCRFAAWMRPDEDVAVVGRRFVRDGGETAHSLKGCCVVSPHADAGRIDELLAVGVEQVLLGESALGDPTLVSLAIARHGVERIGLWLPVRRAEASWCFDTTSNADFSVVSVSNPVPRWVVLLDDRSATDVDALWWAGQMAAAGCSTVLVSVEKPEDDDLLACAEMAEMAGEVFWLDTGSADIDELRFWVRYGQARQLLLPAGCDPDAVAAALETRLACDGEVACSG